MDAAKGDDELTNWLVGFSVAFSNGHHAVEEALALLRAGDGTSRLRLILAILVGAVSESAGQPALEDIALSADDAAATGSVRALILRGRHVRAGPPLNAWFRTLWLEAFLDQETGPLLNPGFVDRMPLKNDGSIVAGGDSLGDPGRAPYFEFPQDSVPLDIWPSNPLDHAEDAERVVMRRIAENGESGVARMTAFRRLPDGAETSEVATEILRDKVGYAPLRERAYERLPVNATYWALIKQGLKTDTDGRVLGTAVAQAAPPPEERPEAARLLEGVLTRPEVQLGGFAEANVLTTLNCMDTQESLDALARLARTGRFDGIRTGAAQAIGEPPVGVDLTKEQRIPLLMGFLQDPDPQVAASGALALLAAQRNNVLKDEARQALDAPTLQRLHLLSQDPHVPQGLRDSLSAELARCSPAPK